MPKLRMSDAQQAIFDDLVDFAGGARMINVPQLAAYWGHDKRTVRDWLQDQRLPRYAMQRGYGYMIRDVSRAMYLQMEA